MSLVLSPGRLAMYPLVSYRVGCPGIFQLKAQVSPQSLTDAVMYVVVPNSNGIKLKSKVL